ncbi:MAG: Uncharacterised protein [Cryomorphaceae bacterium]|nr:MAG: Uncharacterised protein [Cryomorphaceae bacterium]
MKFILASFVPLHIKELFSKKDIFLSFDTFIVTPGSIVTTASPLKIKFSGTKYSLSAVNV